MDRADYQIFRTDGEDSLPNFRVFQQVNGRTTVEEFALHLTDWTSALLETMWFGGADRMDAIKETFFPNSHLTPHTQYSNNHFQWHRVDLADTDRMWFELAAER